MRREHEVTENDRGFWIGILIGLLVVTPVFALTGAESLGVLDVLLMSLASLMVAGIAFKTMVSSPRRSADIDAIVVADAR